MKTSKGVGTINTYRANRVKLCSATDLNPDMKTHIGQRQIRKTAAERQTDKMTDINSDTQTSRQRNAEETKGQTDKQKHRNLENKLGSLVHQDLQGKQGEIIQYTVYTESGYKNTWSDDVLMAGDYYTFFVKIKQ